MKKIFDFVIVLGIIIIIGGAGGYENMCASFGTSLALMLSGASLTSLGIIGREKYIRYRRRCLAIARKKRIAALQTKEARVLADL